jgi:ATP-dependent Lon protease
MSIYDEIQLTDLDRKAREVFGDHVVVKSLARDAALHNLPRYVSEYMIAKYVRPDSWQADLARVQERLKDLLPDLDHRELVKDQLLRAGQTILMDNVEARVDLRNGQRWARVPALADDRVRVPASLLEQHPGLLLGGLWGTVKIEYRPEKDSSCPNEIVNFTPFQIGAPDVEAYRAARARFCADEWMALILRSAGYAPEAFPSRRHRLLLTARLVPLVERNVNLVELGPRQTGKTFLLRNLSPRVFTISGGKTTPANLFVNLATRAVGILGTRKVVVFDEIAHTTFGDEDATLSTLKDYMESGQFSRGAKAFATDASLVFTGNLEVERDQPDGRYRHLFEPLPPQLIDSAFLDRVHGYLPGWEIPKITPSSLAGGVGFVTDYFGEILVQLREENFQSRLGALNFSAGMTQRDQAAVERIGSGLVKLLYPDGKLTDAELLEVAALACEFRQRVHNQLVEIAPGEFKPRLIGHAGLTEHAASDLRSLSRERLPADDRLNREAVVGAVTGLAVLKRNGTGIGGDITLVQVSAFPGHGRVEVTGLHGRVLSDSVRTAYNIVQSRSREFGIGDRSLREQVVAVHLVRMAEPRDGPSAGMAFVAGIVSALTARPIRPAWAMTGEVTLHGEVTGVGGIPWRIKAAARTGRKHILIPADNARELEQVPDEVLGQVEVHPIKTIREALELVLDPGEAEGTGPET